MIGEIVTHSRYGRGVVTAFEPPRIEIRFDGDPAHPRKFAWPAAAARFLTFGSPEAAALARQALETAQASAMEQLAARAEAQRRREEQLAGLFQELQRQKRSEAAKKAAANRAIRLAKAEK